MRSAVSQIWRISAAVLRCREISLVLGRGAPSSRGAARGGCATCVRSLGPAARPRRGRICSRQLLAPFCPKRARLRKSACHAARTTCMGRLKFRKSTSCDSAASHEAHSCVTPPIRRPPLPKTQVIGVLRTRLRDAVVGFYWSFKPPGWILPKKIMLVSYDASLRFLSHTHRSARVRFCLTHEAQNNRGVSTRHARSKLRGLEAAEK